MATLQNLLDGNISVIKQHLETVDLSNRLHILNNSQYARYLAAAAGIEHYKLISWAASLFHDQLVMDIGTYYGSSSIAMSNPENTRVVSYDIVDVKQMNQPYPPNCEYKIGDFRLDPDTLSCPFIFVDVDPHDGIQEKDFHNFFLEKKYKGITMWDDIHLNEVMKNWWNSVNQSNVKKIDLTEVGHWSGTGMIIYEG